MKILHILDHSIPLHSGYAFRTLALLREQRALGWETCQLTSSKHTRYSAAEEDVDGFHFYRTAPLDGLVSRLPVINQAAVVNKLARRLEEVVEEVRPDILHAHSPVLNGLAALRVARRHRLPLVYEVRAFWEDAAVDHGTTQENSLRYRLTRALETRVLRKSSAITTICHGLRNDIIARQIDPEKITVIPNAVDINQFGSSGESDHELAVRYGLEGKTVLGFIGSFYAYEGLALLLQAVKDLIDHDEDIRLLLAGGGPQEEALKQLTRQMGIADQVIFAGRIPHQDVQRYYSLMDILVYPRLSMRLTELVTPLKPLEAMAQAKLVVASGVGGHGELIHDRETGYLFRAGDAQALVDTILGLLRERERWPQLRQAARDFVAEQRTWPVSAAGYKQVYARVTGGHDV